MYSEMWIMSCVLIALGIVCVAAGMFVSYYAQRNERYKGKAEARVVDIVPEPRTGSASLSEFRNRQVAVFEFYAGGHLIKVRDPADTYPCPYHMNQRIPVRYDPGDPQKFYVAGKSGGKILASAANILGVLLILGGCALFLFYASGVEL